MRVRGARYRGPANLKVSNATRSWRAPVETDATRMCELLVGLGNVDVLSVDDTSGEFVEVTVRTRTSRVFCSECGVLAGVAPQNSLRAARCALTAAAS